MALGLAYILLRTRFSSFSILSVLTVTAISLVVLNVGVILTDLLYLVLLPQNAHLSFAESLTLEAMLNVTWTNVLAMAIITTLSGPVSTFVKRRVTIHL